MQVIVGMLPGENINSRVQSLRYHPLHYYEMLKKSGAAGWRGGQPVPIISGEPSATP